MKRLVFAFFLMCGLISDAQVFAPPGAEWYYKYSPEYPTGPYGKYKYDKDTIIQSLSYKVIRHYYSDSLVYLQGEIYVRSDSNSIIVYDTTLNDTYKVFDYTLNIGDSLEFFDYWKAPTPAPCVLDDSYPRFYVHIIGKGIDTINGRTYRYLEYADSWDDDFRGGKYYEKLGFLDGFLINQTYFCMITDQYVESLCYYTDSSSVDTIYGSSCPFTISVKEEPAVNFAIYPNPTTNGTISIQSKDVVKNIELIDMLGQNVLNTTAVGNTVNIGSLTNGIYMAKVVFTNGKVGFKKLVAN